MRRGRRLSLVVAVGLVASCWLGTSDARADGCKIFGCWPPSPPAGAKVVKQDLDAELPGAVSKEPQANVALASDKAIAASCPDCYWAVQQECMYLSESCSSVQTDQCGPRNGWPGDESWTRWVIYFAQPPPAGAGNYSPVGDFCAPGGGGVSLEGLRAAFRAMDFPTPEVHYQPEWGTLVNLETRFWTPAPDLGERVVVVGGVPVTITLHVRWVWAFGDGEVGTFSVPGAPYPDAGVTHAYRVPAAEDVVTVTARYTGTYLGSDLGVVVEKVGAPRGIAVLTAHTELVH